MNNTVNLFRLLIIFAVATALQVFILDSIEIIPLCNPFVYLVFLLSWPFGTRTIPLMLIGLIAGLVIDVASNTPGMHAAACVLACYLRRPILNAIAFRTAYKEDDMPSVHSYGILWYAKYTLLFVTIHHVALFIAEQFDTFYLLSTVLRIIISIVVSTALIMLFASLMPVWNTHSAAD